MDKQYNNGSDYMQRASIWIMILGILVLASCTPTKNSYYFQTLIKDTTLNGLVNKDLESKIVKGDNLSIHISSLSKDEDVIYNPTFLTDGAVNNTGYQVDTDGTIKIHNLGKVKAEGLTRKELSAALKDQLKVFLKDPIVNVQYLNHKITIFGEVGKPQVMNMPEEQLSLIDVLVMSGDVKEDSRRKDIMVIREKGNEKEVKHINLEDHSIFNSPWYYVQPNDIVMVSPDFEKRNKEARRTRLQSTIGIIVSTASLVIIILDRLLR